MKFIKKFYLKFILIAKTVTLSIFLLFKSDLCVAGDHSTIDIRSFKGFKYFNRGDETLLIGKFGAGLVGIYKRNEQKLYVQLNSVGSLLELSTNTVTQVESLLLRSSRNPNEVKLRYDKSPSRKYFRSSRDLVCSEEFKEFQIKTAKLYSKKILSNQWAKSILDVKSCDSKIIGETVRVQLEESLESFFDVEKSLITTCLRDRRVLDLINADPKLLSVLSRWLDSYFGLFSKDESGEPPLVVDCVSHSELPEKLGAIDTRSKPIRVSLNYGYKHSPRNNQSLQITLGHELVHPSFSFPETCLSEANAVQIERLCAEKIFAPELPSSYNPVEFCKKQENFKNVEGKNFGELSAATASDLTAQQQAQNDQATVNIARQFSANPVKLVAEADISAAANAAFYTASGNPIPDSGELIRNAIFPPATQVAVDNAFKSMSSTMDTLNKAMSLAVTPAVAKVAPVPAGNISATPMTRAETVALMECPTSNCSVTPEMEKQFNLPSVSSLHLATTKTQPTNAVVENINSAGVDGSVQEGKTPSQSSVSTTARGKVQADTPSDVSSSANVSTSSSSVASRSPAATKQNLETASTTSIASSVAPPKSKALLIMSSANQISGAAYQDLKNNYNDMQFQKDLVSRRWAIQVVKDGKVTQVLGSRSPSLLFIDENNVLTKKQGAK